MSRSRAAVALLLVAALAAQFPIPIAAQEQDPAAAAGEATIVGSVMGSDGKPVLGARVLAYHLSSAQTFSSAETDQSGRFEIRDLPYGYFDIAVQGLGGLFVANQVVNVPPAGKASVAMTLVRGGTDGSAPRGFAGLDEPATGVAEMGTDEGGSFLTSTTGIAILAGAGAVLLLALALGGDDDEVPASPMNP